jgi:hypothetical protein
MTGNRARTTRGSTTVKPFLGAMLAIAIGIAIAGCADFTYPCSLRVPNALPDGSPVGNGVADDTVLTGATRWGRDSIAVREAVVPMSPQAGLDIHPTPGVLVRDHPAHLQLAEDPPLLAPAGAPALVWQEQSCRYVLVLDRSLTPEQVADFAASF